MCRVRCALAPDRSRKAHPAPGKEGSGRNRDRRIAARIGLVHPKGGGLASLRAGAEIVFRDSRHRVDHRITQLQQFVFLRAGDGLGAFPVILAGQNRGCHRAGTGAFSRAIGFHVFWARPALFWRIAAFFGACFLAGFAGFTALGRRAAFFCAFGLAGFFEAFFFAGLAIIFGVALG